MKSRFVIASLLGLIGVVSAADYSAIEAGFATVDEGVCMTAHPSRTILITHFCKNHFSPDSKCFHLDVGPTDAQSDTVTQLYGTTETVTDGIATSSIGLDVTTTTDAVATSSLPPVGRSVIFLILAPDNNKRDTYRRATRAGFVGNNNPQVCTSATTFILDQGRLVENGMPIFYSGESNKELTGGNAPPGSVTETFEDSGRLVFRNTLLPNGQAGFCQDANGSGYITFSDEPAGCGQVTLGVYDVA
ncbi:hypothetical protein FSHL1_009943 [Fusarium sambucinum]